MSINLKLWKNAEVTDVFTIEWATITTIQKLFKIKLNKLQIVATVCTIDNGEQILFICQI